MRDPSLLPFFRAPAANGAVVSCRIMVGSGSTTFAATTLCSIMASLVTVNVRNPSMMKLVLAIVQDYDCDTLLRAVTDAGFRATRLASTGGFLRAGNTTVFLGVDDERVPECLALIKASCSVRADATLESVTSEFLEVFPDGVYEVTVGGAVIFIASVSRFERYFPADILDTERIGPQRARM